MLKAKDGDFFISDWLRNRNTVEYLGIWEKIHNSDFNYGEYAINELPRHKRTEYQSEFLFRRDGELTPVPLCGIKSKAGLNSYKISVKEWVNKTNAIGLKAKAGRYGGSYAHKDIAFEFGMWISAEFKIYLVKEFQRLKDEESKELDWTIKRSLTKINYRIHTNAIKENLIPEKLSKKQINIVYASEADVLNVALFGETAKVWRDKNPNKRGNIRDYANVLQLVCLANLENINALFIKEKITQANRLKKLNQIAIGQIKILTINESTIKR